MDNCPDCLIKDKEIEQLKGMIESLKQVDRQPWKGKDKPIIERVSPFQWKVTTHVRAGKDEEPNEMVKYIGHNNVKIIWHCVKQTTTDWARKEDYKQPLNKGKHKTDYHELSEELRKFYLKYNLDLMEGNEKKLRNLGKHYFDKYLYPLYILEHLGYVRYSKNVYRIKE